MPNLKRCQMILLFAAIGLFHGVDSQAQPDSAALVEPGLLKLAKLNVLWHRQLPVNTNDRVDKLMIVSDHLYVLSKRNYFFGLDRDKGTRLFRRSLAQPGLPVIGMSLYRNLLLSSVGNRLVGLVPDTGNEAVGKDLGFGVTCAPAANRYLIYVGGSDRHVHRFIPDDLVELPGLAVMNQPLINSIVADDNNVCFSTQAGTVVCLDPNRPRELWKFQAMDRIVSPIVKEGGSIYVSSRDTYVYKLDERYGSKAVWKYQAPGILDRGPHVTKQAVYQFVWDKGLIAIDKTTGKALWQLPESLDLVAEAPGKAYVMKNGELVVMDNRTGKKVHSINFVRVKHFAVNTQDSKIYVADDAGSLMCLEPEK